MCGIVGSARGAGGAPLSLEDVRRMAAAIVHRGPDDEGFHTTPDVILGMRRLSIIDLSGGHQPIANEDETLWVVCNGEIYNFRELRAGLKSRGHAFRTGSDVEVILHLYEEHGERFVEHLSGMYGIALWDERRKRLILARDRMGQKPLYYRIRDGAIEFASEVKALLAASRSPREVDVDAMRDYLSLGYSVAPATIFKGVRKLPPASVLIWERSGWRIENYWRIPDRTHQDASEQEWIERIRSELRRAVSDHMVSDVPIGAFLSGGVDSSAVVALMSETSEQPVNTYSIGYGGPGAASYYNELAFAGAVARRYKTNHREILVAPKVATLLPKLLWHVEEPISDSAIVTTYLVAELAAKSVKVILSGVGGDELFAGYRRYLGDHYQRRYHRLPRWLRTQLLKPLAAALPSGRSSKLMDMARYAKKFVGASDLPWTEQYREFIEICSRRRLSELLLQGATGQTGFDRIAALEGAEDPLLRLMRIDAQTQLPEDLLLLTDKITMATSIECRVPFLDHRLVELGAQIPAEMKMRGGELKHILKRSLADVLPHEILYRSKRGFGAPMGSWLKTELAPLRRVLLGKAAIESRGLMSWPAVQSVIEAHDQSREDFTDLLL
ncbi:MAG TPA: asparagine synthase (glutamine-hydrolyzing), partial [Steroidobacter sp.]|nr:asparagine synthase (glutamine-hydrolyzing) [Steroidobacter sp.]